MTGPSMPANAFVHIQHCAVINQGCEMALVYSDDRDTNDPDTDLLEANGWRLDNGQWICNLHPQE